jgi:sec-independent protein translocase protein TatA
MNTLALLPNLAGPDMLIIFMIVLIMFGAKKLPELARGLGQAVKEFSKAKEDVNHEFNRAMTYDEAHGQHVSNVSNVPSHAGTATPASAMAAGPSVSAAAPTAAVGTESAAVSANAGAGADRPHA